jgi:hypothetical protein
VKIEVIEQL